jgi:hypothetical protein
MLGVLGNESSSSEGEDGGGDNASAPNEVEGTSAGHRSSMAPLVEESKDEPEHEPPPTRPLNPMPLIGSWREEDKRWMLLKLLYFWVSVLLLLFFTLCFYACH